MRFEYTKIRKTDLHFLNEVRNECAYEYLHDSRTFTLYETIDWFIKNDPEYWIIWDANYRIGYFRLHPDNNSCVIGADLHKDFRGRGYAKMAYKEFMEFVMNRYNVDELNLEVLSNNYRAFNLYIDLGFEIVLDKTRKVDKNDKLIISYYMKLNRQKLYENRN